MTCRSVVGVVVVVVTGVLASGPASGAGGVEGAGVTIELPVAGEVGSRRLVVAGEIDGAGPVWVSVAPQGLPEGCGSGLSGPASVSDGGRYRIQLDVACNGPHRVEVRVGGPEEGRPVVRDIGVTEPPPTPRYAELDVTEEGGLAVTWDPTEDLDAVGWVLRAGVEELPFTADITGTTLTPEYRRRAVSLKAVRWGAGGPGTTVASDWSIGNLRGGPYEPEPEPEPERQDPTPPPAPRSPAPSVPSVPVPSAPSRSGPPPSQAAGAPSSVPEVEPGGPPLAVPGDASTLRDEPSRRPSSEVAGRAVATPAPAVGLVRTEEQPPSRLGAFVVGLLVLALATLVARHARRSTPGTGR